MTAKFNLPVKFIFVSFFIFIFIIIINFSSLFSSYTRNQAFAQSFKFYAAGADTPITGGFTFIKNSGGAISYPQIYQDRLWFAEPISLEKPPYIQFTFLSDKYSINYSKTPAEVAKIIKGEAVAGASSIYKIYLNANNNPGFSYNPNRTANTSSIPATPNPAGAKFNFGHNYNLPGANNVVKQTPPQTQTQIQTQPQKQTQPLTQVQTTVQPPRPAYTNTNPYSANKFGGAQSVQNRPLVSSLNTTNPDGIKSQNNNNSNFQNTISQPAVPAQTVNNTTRGGVSGYITGGSTTFGGGSVIVSVTNSNNQFIKSQIVNTDPDGSVYPYSISGIPPILPGSNDYYKISVTSNNGFQSTQYPQSNIKIYGADQTVQAQPIVMQARRGRINITLYHARPALNENEQSLGELARNAVINISGAASSARYTGESPARFYRYTIDDAPAGKRQLSIMFPGHSISGGSVKEVTIPADSTASVLYNLSE